jgi:two-component system cell cycle response regulator CpdR
MARTGPADPSGVGPTDNDARRPARGRSVLVVDDDPSIRDFVVRALRRHDCDVRAAAGGREALRLVADGTFRPATLLTDIDMPDMTGIELAARLAALRPGLRIVMMTGDQLSAAAARARPDMVADVLLKPMTVAELLEAVGATASPSVGSDDGRR